MRLFLSLVAFTFTLGLPSQSLAQEKAVETKALPYGFLELDSEEIPPSLKDSLGKAASAVGRLELRAKVDLTTTILKGDRIGHATGFVTKPGDVLTTVNHFVKDFKENPATLELFLVIGGETIPVEKILDQDEKNDAARLLLPKKRDHFLEGDEAAPATGSPVVMIGYPRGVTTPKVTIGRVIGSSGAQLILTNPSLPGNSGGPALAIDKKGAVHGYFATVGSTLVDPALEELNALFFYASKATAGTKPAARKNDPLRDRNLKLFKMLRSDEYKKETQTVSTAVQKALEDLAKILAEQTKWEAGVKDRVRQLLGKVNDNLKVQSKVMCEQAATLYNLPLITDSALDDAVANAAAPKDLVPMLTEWTAVMRAADKQREERMKADLEKLAFHLSAEKVLKSLDVVQKDPALRNTAAHLNQSYFYSASQVNPGKSK